MRDRALSALPKDLPGHLPEDLPAPARLLAPREQVVLDLLLSQDFPGVQALREQARGVRAARGCTCGCGTIDLVPPPDAPLADLYRYGLAPTEAEVRDGNGEPLGGVMLFVEQGLLSSLEVYSFVEDPLPMPTLDQLVVHGPAL